MARDIDSWNRSTGGPSYDPGGLINSARETIKAENKQIIYCIENEWIASIELPK